MNETLKRQILIVDDAADNRQILADLLKPDYTVLLAKNGQQALERAASHHPDLILLDVLMSDMSGYDVMQQLQEQEATAAIPVMLITKLDTPDDEINGLHQGAVDYITKPFNFTVVKARVRTQIRLYRQRQQLQALANVDGLTEIPNRRHFDQALAAEWGRARRSQQPLSVAMVDVDYFKRYNDRFGHAQGDRALQAVARALSATLRRPGDLVARYGGEEFVLLMPATDAEGAMRLADAACVAVLGLDLPNPSGGTEALSVSLGIATLAPAQESTPAALLAQADSALYAAKTAGRNCIRVWRPTDTPSSPAPRNPGISNP